MDLKEAITILENTILDAKIHNNDETCDCIDGVNCEALETILKEVKSYGNK